MKNLPKNVELRVDIGKLMKSIDGEIDAYLASVNRDRSKLQKKIFKVIHEDRKEETRKLASYMSKKYSKSK